MNVNEIEWGNEKVMNMNIMKERMRAIVVVG